MMSKKEFYEECDKIFGQSHLPPTTQRYRGRWGPRTPGSGRFEGYGLVRWFSPSLVHISLRQQVALQTYMTAHEALVRIAEIVNNK